MHSIDRVSPVSTSSSEELESSRISTPTSSPYQSDLGVKVQFNIPQIQNQLNHICDQVDRGEIEPGEGHLACMELLSKQLAYLREGTLRREIGKSQFQLVVPTASGEGYKKASYQIDDMVHFGNNLAGGHLTSFSLKPMNDQEGTNPIVIYHGTKNNPIFDDNPTDTFLANFDPRGIGRSALNLWGTGLEKELNNFYDRTTRGGTRKALVIGHSLGGTLAELSAVYKPDAVAKTYAFNAPASHFYAYQKAQIDQQTAKLDGTHYPKIYRFETAPGTDPITELGSRKIGHVVHVARKNEMQGLKAHKNYMFVDNFNGFLGDEKPSTDFNQRLEAAWNRGQERSNEFNSQRDYYMGIPKHKGLLAQTLASTIGYPILLGAVGLTRALIHGQEFFSKRSRP